MRNPKDPIPGFEDEFYGTVGHEKRFHKTHFGVSRTLRKTKSRLDEKYVWVRVGVGRYRLVKKQIETVKRAQGAEVTNGQNPV